MEWTQFRLAVYGFIWMKWIFKEYNRKFNLSFQSIYATDPIIFIVGVQKIQIQIRMNKLSLDVDVTPVLTVLLKYK